MMMTFWARLGVSVAIAAAFYIIITEAFRDRYYEQHRWHICVGLIGVGIALWLVGRMIKEPNLSAAAKLKHPDQPEGLAESHESLLLLNPAYWGVMLVVFGLMIAIIVPARHAGLQPLAARTNSTTPAKKKSTSFSPHSKTNRSGRFPTFKLQGVVYRQSNSSLLINGRTFFLGESVEGAKILAIDPQHTIFEWEGQRIIMRTPGDTFSK
jgi:hypothetical protein